jgi:enduracididine beta-hydroxylase
MYRVEITESQLTEIQMLANETAARYETVENGEFQREATTYAHELPRDIRTGINTFRLREPSGICVVSGYQIDDSKIGPTPTHWANSKSQLTTRCEEFFFFLVACLLGDPFAWATQQDGFVMHDVLPIKGHEHEQIGSGSEELLAWHTEDAFHPLRADYLGLMCLRNEERVETTLATIDDIELDDDLIRVLREERFPIRPDRSHLPVHRSTASSSPPGTEELLRRSYDWIEQLIVRPTKVAILFGSENSPYLRLDPYFMELPQSDSEAVQAFDTLTRRIDEAVVGYSLRPGEVMFLDNFKVVHGRKPFKARFDGTDRWLKRLNISRDLRKSRAERLEADTRTIY